MGLCTFVLLGSRGNWGLTSFDYTSAVCDLLIANVQLQIKEVNDCVRSGYRGQLPDISPEKEQLFMKIEN